VEPASGGVPCQGRCPRSTPVAADLAKVRVAGSSAVVRSKAQVSGHLHLAVHPVRASPWKYDGRLVAKYQQVRLACSSAMGIPLCFAQRVPLRPVVGQELAN
jgi:hypothetical protein